MAQEGRQAVGYIGMDVRNREGHVCPPDEGGAVVLEQRIRTKRRRFASITWVSSSLSEPYEIWR